MAEFGVTGEGFVPKSFDIILSESRERARAVFAGDLDLTATSTLNMLLQVVAAEDAELWKRLEETYYANFVSTASGATLDLLGDDVEVARRESFLTGTVLLTLNGGVAGRVYVLPQGTLLITADTPAVGFATAGPVELSTTRRTADVRVDALTRGLADRPIGAITEIDPGYRAAYLGDFGNATVQVTNALPLTGGREPEDDDAYRGRLLGVVRNLWTLESVRQAALDVDGVIDVLLSDPLGGVDVSQSYFGEFSFSQRQFSAERRVGEPYLFDVVVAHDVRRQWRATGADPGVHERVRAALDRVRPPGIHPNIIEADHIDVGVRARVIVEPGHDGPAVLAAIRGRLAREIGGLRLGGDVLYSQVMGAFVAEPGVVDVRHLRLRRFPAAFGRITFGAVAHQSGPVEAAAGENLVMGPTELAVFAADSALHDLEAVTS
jgi:phage-related baseplate assembly protein